jgi:hypothetical protein
LKKVVETNADVKKLVAWNCHEKSRYMQTTMWEKVNELTEDKKQSEGEKKAKDEKMCIVGESERIRVSAC